MSSNNICTRRRRRSPVPFPVKSVFLRPSAAALDVLIRLLLLLFLMAAAGGALARAQEEVPAGSDISTLINQGYYDMLLTGPVTWNNALDINSAARSSLTIDGGGNTVTVRAAGNSMISNFAYNNSRVYLNNINFVPSAPYTAVTQYLIGFSSSNITSYLNLSGSTFQGFNRTNDKGGTIIYALASGSAITIDGGADGVVFRNNRAEWDAAGAVAVGYSNMTFNGTVTFEGNWTGNYGGALAVYEYDNTVTFNGTTYFRGNHSVVFGGAVDVWGGQGKLVFNGESVFDGNYAFYNHGVVDFDNPRRVTDQHARGGAINVGYISTSGAGSYVEFNNKATFTNNYVISNGPNTNNRNALGGAISVYGNNSAQNYRLIFNDAAVFDGNYVYSVNGSAYGGAVYYDSASAQLSLTSGTQFLNNYAKTLGGAIYLQSGIINLSAANEDIIFRGNRHGVDFTGSGGSYTAVPGSGTPNAIYLGTGGTFNMDAAAGFAIRFDDPIASVAGSLVTVNKTGAGEVIFTGDGGATSDYDSDIQANTNVTGGSFTLADGVKYGSTSFGTFTVGSGAAVRGGGGGAVRAGNVVIQTGGSLGAQGGLFTVDSGTIGMQTGSILTGYGTLAAASSIVTGGAVTADIASGRNLTVTAVLSGVGGIDKTNSGTLTLAAVNTYTGATVVTAGTLAASADNVFAQSSSVSVGAGAVLNLDGTNQLANNLTGSGDIVLGAGTLSAQSSASTSFSGSVAGTGSLVKTGGSQLTLSGNSSYSGGTSVTAGTLTAQSGTALGTGLVNTAAAGALVLDFAGDETFANQLSGPGSVTKTGAGTAFMTGTGSSAGNVTVQTGEMAFGQNGNFRAANYTTAGGATTTIGENSTLIVTGVFTQETGSFLNVDIGDNEPAVSAASALIAGTLEITGFDSGIMGAASSFIGNRYTVIATTDGITGDFDSIVIGTAANPVDYLAVTSGKSDDNRNYYIGVGLTWFAGTQRGNGVFTLTNASDSFTVDVVLTDQTGPFTTLWNGRDLTKRGLGTLTLAEANTYTGTTSVEAGTLAAGAANAFAQSSAVSVSAGASLALNGYNQTAQNLTGGGSIALGTAALTVQNSGSTEFSGDISGTGSVILGSGQLTLSGSSTYSGGTSISAGTEMTARTGSSLGTGAVSIAGTGELVLDFAGDETVANQLSGTGALTKTGAGTARLTSTGSAGAVSLQEGTLSFEQSGVFSAASYTTVSGTTTSFGESSRLVTSGNYTQAAGSFLNIEIGNNEPVISARTANIAGMLDITGFDTEIYSQASQFANRRFTIISTTEGITGDFDGYTIGTVIDPVDYLTIGGSKSADSLTYSVFFGLTWLAGEQLGNGVFTLTDASDIFDVDIVLTNQTGPFDSSWTGTDLTKRGDGTLTLSRANTYTGITAVEGGTLSAGIADAFARSSAVSVSAGAVLALNGYNQTAQNLSGAGAITLGNAALTVQNGGSTEFSGVISGTGSVALGSGQLTLSGDNTYSGGTSVAGGAVLTAAGGQSLGTGTATVSSGAELELAFSGDETLANRLTGSGTLSKTGAGTARLTASGSSAGTVDVRDGELSYEQSGSFSAVSHTTRGGAEVSFAAGSQLTLTGTFTQESGSVMNVDLGSVQPIVSAYNAVISGNLNVTGFGDGDLARASSIPSRRFVIISTEDGITGDFSNVTIDSVSPVDYLTVSGSKSQDELTYSVGIGLTWLAGPALADGTFTLTNANDSFIVDVALENQTGPFTSSWDGQSLTKRGLGTLTLSAVNGYSGNTIVEGGTLAAGIDDAFAQSTSVQVNAGARLALNGFSQTAQNLTGGGDISLGTAVLTVQNSGPTEFSGNISGAGSVALGSGQLSLSGSNTYTGGTAVNGGVLIAEDSLSLGTGAVSTAAGAELRLDYAAGGEFANSLSGSGTLAKTGAGTATLTASGSAAGSVDVRAGTLSFEQTGTFSAGSYITQSSASTSLSGSSSLSVTNTYTQTAGSFLNVEIGSGNNPAITARSADLQGGTLTITGFDGNNSFSKASDLPSSRFTVIHTTGGGISGDFSSVDIGTSGDPVDYLTMSSFNDGTDFAVGFALTWKAGTPDGDGTFTLTNADDIFTVDVVLGNETGSFASSWDGQSLTKEGLGTLILSAANTYTGATDILAGTLRAGAADVFAESTAVSVEAGAVLDLNNYSQTAQNLTGAGSIALGSGVLTVENTGSTEFSGVVSGTGSVSLAGGRLTLAGDNTYSGGTSVAGGAVLTAVSGRSLGTGTANIGSGGQLALDFSGDETLTNTLTGDGDLVKSGAGTAHLTSSSSSVGSVTVEEGTLSLDQDGTFAASGDYTTEAGAVTMISGTAQLEVGGEFTQEAGAVLNVTVGQNPPAVTADTAVLAGTLNVSGFTADVPASASQLGSQNYLVISAAGISGDFSSVTVGPAMDPTDFLTVTGIKTATEYSVGFGLTWYAGEEKGNGIFTLTGPADSFDVDVALNDETGPFDSLWTGRDLTKAGSGTLILSADNNYTGFTHIEAGTLAAGTANTFQHSSEVTVGADGTLDIGEYDQIARNLSGSGSIRLGTAELTVRNSGSTVFSGEISGSGSLALDGGQLTLSGSNTYTGGTAVENGTLVAQQGDSLGAGSADIAAGAVLQLDFAGDETFANTLSGSGSLIKTGAGTAELTGTGSSAGSVSVTGGALSLQQDGVFEAGSYTTASGAETIIGGESMLAVTGAFTQDAGSTLWVTIGSYEPIITAGSASLAGELIVSGFGSDFSRVASDITSQRFVVIRSDTPITGDFDPVDLGSAASPVDYLTLEGFVDGNEYVIDFGLTWYAGTTLGNGVFTIDDANDFFEVDVALNDESGSATGWNGKNLTKRGDGTLILGAVNGYTGDTLVEDGTLQLNIANAIQNSSSVTVDAGAVLNLNSYDQIIQQLSGDGSVTLGSAEMTVQNSSASTFGGVISGTGSVALTGGGSLTLTGDNTYTGGTNITNGTLIAGSGQALGTGTADIAAGSVLQLDFASDDVMANQLTGGGSLIKTGSTTASLTGTGSSVGTVEVQQGTLYLNQNGVFTSGSYTTSAGAATTIGENAQLNVTSTFTKDAGATFNIIIGTDNEPMVTARDAVIAGDLTITGFDPTLPASALTARRHTVIETTDGISGTFDTVDFGGTLIDVDYLLLNGALDPGGYSYSVGFALTWFAGPAEGNGVFTLTDPNNTFDVDVVLSDQTGGFVSAWNGRDLTKAGAGTLILSAANTYTGSTTVSGGTLDLRADGALGGTSVLTVADGARTLLNGTSQSVGQLFTESGSLLDTGTGTLTVNSAQRTDPSDSGGTVAGGTLTGSGSLILDSSDLTVLGDNTAYAGSVTVQGSSVLTMGSAAGLGSSGSLTLSAAGDSLIFADTGSGAPSGTFGKNLSGAGAVQLQDGADITLTGNSTGFTGIFDIQNGTTLHAGAAQNLGSADITADGTLDLSSTGAWTLNNTVTGNGDFLKTGSGQLSVGSSLAGFGGASRVAAGTLIVGTASDPGAVLGGTGVTIDADGALSGTGTVTGPVNNSGIIAALNSLEGYENAGPTNFTIGQLTHQGDIVLAGAQVGNTLTVRGGMTGIGGILVINTVLGGDDSPTDRLILDGGTTDGNTGVIVKNFGGTGGETNVGIMVVEAANGATTTENAFTLLDGSRGVRAGYGSLVAGAFDYELLRGGNGGDPNSWYLLSDRMVRPEAGGYLANRDAAEDLFSMTMYDRLDGYEIGADPETGEKLYGAAWGRMRASKSRSYAGGGSVRSDSRMYMMQTGADLAGMPVGSMGSFRAGVMGGLGNAHNKSRSAGSSVLSSKGSFTAWQLGAYMTWFGDSNRRDGWYADTWVQFSHFQNRVSGTGLPREKYSSRVWSGSAEAGYAIPLLQTEQTAWSVVPTVQLTYNDFTAGQFTESSGTVIRHKDGGRLVTRAGARFKGLLNASGRFPSEPYAEFNWMRRGKKSSIAMNEDTVTFDSTKNVYEMKLGWETEIARSLRLGVSVFGQTGDHRFRQYGGQLGVRYEW